MKLRKLKRFENFINENSDEQKLNLYFKHKNELMELRKNLKLYYFDYNMGDVIYDEISKENPDMTIIDNLKNDLIQTNEEMEKLETIIEDNNDREYEIKHDLFCVKPFGDYSEILNDKLENGKLIRKEYNLEIDPSEYSAYFGLDLKFANEFEGSHYNKKVILPEMKSIFKLISSIENSYKVIKMILNSSDGLLYVFFKTI
jgi:hypothetical protein